MSPLESGPPDFIHVHIRSLETCMTITITLCHIPFAVKDCKISCPKVSIYFIEYLWESGVSMLIACTLISLRLAGLPDSASLRLINGLIDVHGLM